MHVHTGINQSQHHNNFVVTITLVQLTKLTDFFIWLTGNDPITSYKSHDPCILVEYARNMQES